MQGGAQREASLAFLVSQRSRGGATLLTSNLELSHLMEWSGDS